MAAAYERVAPHVHRTPVLTCSALDTLAGRNLHFKCEVLQRTGSFKIRGATNAALLAPPGAPLVTHSSGNHAQALALASHLRVRKSHATCWIISRARAREALNRRRVRLLRNHIHLRVQRVVRRVRPDQTP